MRNRPRGRHVARRRRVLGPVLASGLVASTSAVSVALPAHAAEGTPDVKSDVKPLSPTPVAPYHVLGGTHLTAKAPQWALPVTGYHLTGRFGQVSGLWSSFHTGLDFATAEGSQIHSIAAGTVVSTGYDGAYGNKTVVRLADGTELWYCHQSSFGVRPGQRLRAGDLVGYVGSTGNTTGPHLHLEVHPDGGDAVDPEAWLPTHGLHP